MVDDGRKGTNPVKPPSQTTCEWGGAAAYRRYLHLLVLQQKVTPETKCGANLTTFPEGLPENARELWDSSMAGDYDELGNYEKNLFVTPSFSKVSIHFYLYLNPE
jgi:hypothetical protein